MDIYIISFSNGSKEEYRVYSFFCDRLSELESLGYEDGKDFKHYQLWL